jgi:uncharacterized membrane protein YjfL (UPF0719 family)
MDEKKLLSKVSIALFAMSVLLGFAVLLALAFSASDSPLSHHHWGTTALVAFIPSAGLALAALFVGYRASH